MESRPTSLNVGALFAALGGVGAIITMILVVDLQADDAIGKTCYMLLLAIVMFAVAGGFKKNGQWPIELMIIMTFAAIALIVVGVILKIFGIWVMISLLIDAIIVMASVLGCLSSSVWFGTVDE